MLTIEWVGIRMTVTRMMIASGRSVLMILTHVAVQHGPPRGLHVDGGGQLLAVGHLHGDEQEVYRHPRVGAPPVLCGNSSSSSSKNNNKKHKEQKIIFNISDTQRRQVTRQLPN